MSFSLGGALSGAVSGFSMGGWWGAAAGAIAGGVAGGAEEDKQKKAARQLRDAQKQSLAAQQGQYSETKNALAPFLAGGLEGQNMLMDVLKGRQTFENDPLMQAQFSQAGKLAGRYASAGGQLGTGAYKKNLLRGVSDVYNNRINQLMTLSGRGQSGNFQLGGLGQNYANNLSDIYGNMGNIGAAQSLGQANTIAGQTNDLFALAKNMYGGSGGGGTQVNPYYGNPYSTSQLDTSGWGDWSGV